MCTHVLCFVMPAFASDESLDDGMKLTTHRRKPLHIREVCLPLISESTTHYSKLSHAFIKVYQCASLPKPTRIEMRFLKFSSLIYAAIQFLPQPQPLSIRLFYLLTRRFPAPFEVLLSLIRCYFSASLPSRRDSFRDPPPSSFIHYPCFFVVCDSVVNHWEFLLLGNLQCCTEIGVVQSLPS